ncbi:MAG: 16S rRNA processing protein RimM [Magnetococcales bacterium]|nr:16S rRNA processing protein RimM [Magnetococcales bacterium]
MPRIAGSWIAVGRIRGSFGVRGDLKVEPWTGTREALFRFRQLWMGQDPLTGPLQPLAVESWHPHGATDCTLKTGTFANREEAAKWRGSLLWLPREELPEVEEDAVYWVDLLGARVVDGDGVALGLVEEILETGANDVLVIRDPQGEERLLPFTAEVVRHWDETARVLTVSLFPGL